MGKEEVFVSEKKVAEAVGDFSFWEGTEKQGLPSGPDLARR